MMFDYRTENIGDWVMRFRKPNLEGFFPAYLLLHGWTGDENSMWVFESRMPDDAYLITLRGFYPTPLGGYGWQSSGEDKWPTLNDFQPAINSILEVIEIKNFPQCDFSDLTLVGFSQGASLAYAFSIEHPEIISAIAALSGFLPNDVETSIDNINFKDLPIYITHGNLDELVPVKKARTAVEVLSRAGAKVSYCEESVGHKLSAACFNGMESFFNSQ